MQCPVGVHHVADQGGQVEALVLRRLHRPLDLPRRRQRIHQRAHAIDAIAGATQPRAGRGLFGLQVVERAAHYRERRPELVGEPAAEALEVEVVVADPGEQAVEAAREVAQFVVHTGAGKAAGDLAALAHLDGRGVPQAPDAKRQQGGEAEQHGCGAEARQQRVAQQAPGGGARQGEDLGSVALHHHDGPWRPGRADRRGRSQQAPVGQRIAPRVGDAQRGELHVPAAELAGARRRWRVRVQLPAEDAAIETVQPAGAGLCIDPRGSPGRGEHEPCPVDQENAVPWRRDGVQRGLRRGIGARQPPGCVAEAGFPTRAVRLQQAHAESIAEQGGGHAGLDLPAAAGGLPVTPRARVVRRAAHDGGDRARRFQRKLDHRVAADDLQDAGRPAARGDHEQVHEYAAPAGQQLHAAEGFGETRGLAPVLDEAVQPRRGGKLVQVEIRAAAAAGRPAVELRVERRGGRRQGRPQQARARQHRLFFAVAQRRLDLARVLATGPWQQQGHGADGQQLAGQLHEAAPSRQR